MGISRYATAHWEGDLKSGQGKLNTPASGLLADTPYGFNSRFGDQKGTNPEGTHRRRACRLLHHGAVGQAH
jgi:osmotically inducible protein OsmC